MHGLIRRQNLDGSNIEIVARGVRNSVGFDWHPQTKELWFTDNGRDWAGDDGPEDELNRVAKPTTSARFFGFPYCHANGIADPDIKRPNACAGVTLPAATLGPACRPRSACASTPATCSRPTTRTTPSSPGADPGTAPRSSAMTWCWPRSTAPRRPSRRS